ncbi:phosphonate C-P lyase system protein PhnH [Microlunatus speluncae]|uniref:phosphonate C-P lyase system protein PhnH n=1 Tax=Microlunatus speluncae TaxID=2594267 RepID=UPI0013754E0D|nr:phosphonate C-P lyase system protein PhnH [Microlunatus speluncae]
MTLIADPRSAVPSDADADWPVLRALSADTSQRVFRACLDALARPGTRHALPIGVLPAGVPPVALAPLALTDLMAPLAGLGAASGLARRVATATGARLVDPEQARFALALADSGELVRLPIGSAWSPEFGAMLCQRVGAVRGETGPALRQAQGTNKPAAQGTNKPAAQGTKPAAQGTNKRPAGGDVGRSAQGADEGRTREAAEWSAQEIEQGAQVVVGPMDQGTIGQAGQGANVSAEELRLTLTGPGIKDATMIMVAGLGVKFFTARAELIEGFPAGIDVLLITDDGTVTGLPRTTRIEVG